jgi:hypothetical protein
MNRCIERTEMKLLAATVISIYLLVSASCAYENPIRLLDACTYKISP